MIKTAEEILREYVKFDDVNGNKPVRLLPLTIVDAMEEYAEQFKLNKPDVSKSVCCNAALINFNTYGYNECSKCGNQFKQTDC